MGFIKRADTENLWSVFEKYASVSKNGQKYMTSFDFMIRYLGLFDESDYNQNSVNLLAGVVDTSKDNFISFEEFQAFEGLLCCPDAQYATAFQLFDRNSNGYINFEEFKEVMSHTTLNEHIPFDFNSEMMNLHFGRKKNRFINYMEFTQILHDFHEEHALQAFKKFDRGSNGSISVSDFNQIMVLLKSHLMTPYVRENLINALYLEGDHSRRVSFPFFMAFISLLNNMEMVKRIYHGKSHGNKSVELSRDDFLSEAQHYSQITPLEIEILFNLVDIARKDGRICYKDIENIAPIRDETMTYYAQSKTLQDAVETKAEGKGRTVFISILESLYRFGLGAIAGATGATAVYPIDLVKTRLQNQRSGSMVGELMYKNSWDCFKKVLTFEGFTGLYRGLAPQLAGVAPEKAIKLTVNDLVKDHLSLKDGDISFLSEMIAGACAGGSQVVFTNPLEIIKIRLQVAGEIASTRRISAISVIRELGFFGLYKGSRACFLRDIPFSAIYFPAYNHLKKASADENGYNNPGSLFMSATIAGAPAASLVTPADVIKTRLQVAARKGETTYTGVFDAFRKIVAEEGGRALWKGAPARVFRSSPQFGVTLLCYEMLQRLFYVDFGGRKTPGANIQARPSELLPMNPDHIGGYKLASITFDGIESKFGVCLPKYRSV